MCNEEWRPVKDWEGLYEVSNLGNVRGLADEKDAPLSGPPEKVPTNYEKPYFRKAPQGCARVWLWRSLWPDGVKERKHRSYEVWRLVLEAFAPFTGGPVTEVHDLGVEFNDGDIRNHCLANISWVYTPNKYPKGSLRVGQKLYCTWGWETHGIRVTTIVEVVTFGRHARVRVSDDTIDCALALDKTVFKTEAAARRYCRKAIKARIASLKGQLVWFRKIEKGLVRPRS